MCAVVREILCGKKLMHCNRVNIDSTFPKNDYILITGKVISPYKVPLPYAAIKVFSIDTRYSPTKKKYVGVTFSDEQGIYGISVPRYLEISYELKAYGAIYE
ncbi:MULTISPECIES: carboxypeptidase regulatory-like domain-containing protein [Clostridium]|uniref:Carboxypeptidase regulatory-like domain-containing protein n=1 Tax=Clostridium aquiflavi TaxID=3073603 RepID=A0ABU1EBZ6_9CLOT|nr:MULTISPECIES: carboxypeptidase regulatory-like domain-containing protein [unclassified Clostridium]MDR5585911.1 carboxypeptidase regulatory-like domain-containing protein [Clostridium sp. 5N-1]NFG60911.1 carboxypeptidase regulatory-like domain-containing protein [Clostridium botulinum]NFQ09504.1 carboxypeptidase regulatory-like domain-containing protein [Clostridium botulinum]